MEHDITTPFGKGQRAAFDGYARSTNPYPAGSPDALQWLLGFNAECQSESSQDESEAGDNA